MVGGQEDYLLWEITFIFFYLEFLKSRFIILSNPFRIDWGQVPNRSLIKKND